MDILELIRTRDLRRIFQNKYVVFMGDSNMRSIYKDFIQLIQEDRLISDADRKAGGNKESICGDVLVEGGIYKNLASGIEYEEKRVFLANLFLVKFFFLTRCWNEMTTRIFEEFRKDSEKPDLIVINSTLWDISRYGESGEKEFKKNLPRCFDELRASTSPTTIILWLTALPISAEPNAAVFDEKCLVHHTDLHCSINLCHFSISDRPENKYWRTLFLHTNAYSAELAKKKNCEVLDLHYLLRQHPDLRDSDGCHWNATGHRMITSYIAQLVSLIWHVPYLDRQVIDHKEREFHQWCHRLVNKETNKSVEALFTDVQDEGIADFDLNTYLAEHIPITKTTEDGKKNENIDSMLSKMNETDQRILHLMNYYEKQT